MSRSTTFARSLIKTVVMLPAIALAAIPAAPALAASGPQQVLYIFPGVTDKGADATGVATAVHCFSFSPASETIQAVLRNFDGAQLGITAVIGISQFHTITIETHFTNLYTGDFAFEPSTNVNQGVIGISATSTNIVCTANIIDSSAVVPNGIDLHGTRFNPISGSQE